MEMKMDLETRILQSKSIAKLQSYRDEIEIDFKCLLFSNEEKEELQKVKKAFIEYRECDPIEGKAFVHEYSRMIFHDIGYTFFLLDIDSINSINQIDKLLEIYKDDKPKIEYINYILKIITLLIKANKDFKNTINLLFTCAKRIRSLINQG